MSLIRKIAVAVIVIVPLFAIACSVTPGTSPTTQPATQPAGPTPNQIANGAADAVLTYGPTAQIIMSMIPQAAAAAGGVAIAMLVAAMIKKYTAPGAPRFDPIAIAEELAPKVAAIYPSASTTSKEIATIASLIEAAVKAKTATA